MSRNTLKRFFRKRQFINPINLCCYHRRKIAEEVATIPFFLPSEDDEETILTTTLLLQAIRYETEPMPTEKREKSA